MDDKYEGEYPVLQVLGTKKVSGVGGSERYRLLLSDGQYLQSFAMLATHLNGMVENGDLSEHAIIRVKQHLATAVNTSAKWVTKLIILQNFVHAYNSIWVTRLFWNVIEMFLSSSQSIYYTRLK